jgi:aspartyl-tRNA(Asn)/glutamyl-tRNA(Gln) amidotransferase subunit A
MPHGFVNGLPVGIQLIGNYLEESMILNFANRFQQSTDFHNAKPTFEGF